ncbi:MAG: 2-oxo acid dehydrogenase subunit E2 [Ardenticatenales bacterium]|nr:2-oxo acid dehydrogenase subunit E2 [Ardenticatenales bacterium]
MPKLGFDMREGELVSWVKQVGDQVNKGDIVAEIESDKATLELESQVSGVLLKTLYEPGAVVAVGENLAIVGEAGEDVAGLAGGAAPAAPKAAAQEEAPAAAADEPVAAAPAAAPVAEANGEFPAGVKATPVARRIASENDVNLLQVSGSGPGGRVRKADVEAFLSAPRPAAAPAAAAAPAVAVSSTPVTIQAQDEEVKTSRLRQAIARRMTESKVTVPHFYVTTEIDMAAAMALRKQVNEMLPPEKKVSVNDIIVKAAGVALREFPNLNASFNGSTIVRHGRINVGSAVAVEGGLLTVVQKDTDVAPLSKVAADNRAMIARARDGKIHPDDVDGGTFTVSNLGIFDVDHFIAIINPPEAAILAIGSVQEKAVVVNGELTIGLRMKATISADHRVSDGAEAAQFMQRLKGLLETPLGMLV